MITVYGVHGSPFVRKVFIALDIKEIPYDIVPQMPFSGDSDYLAINPLGKIPALTDGDLTLADSKVICRYIEDAYPEPALYPNDAADRARADWLEELGGGAIADMAAGIFFQRFMRPRAFKQEPDENLITKIIEERLPPMLDYLEAQLPDHGWLFGNFTLADLSLASPFFNASYAGYEIDNNQWPRMSALVAATREHPAVARVLAKEARALGLN